MTFSTYTLDEITFIGGTNYTLTFNVYNSNGTSANLAGKDCGWKMCPFGYPEIVTLEYSSCTQTGANTFEVVIPSADTLTLSGKYVHQPIITDGTEDYRSEQGLINIDPAIQ